MQSSPVRRPTGITILAVLAFLAGAWGLLQSCVWLGIGGLALLPVPPLGGLILVFGIATLLYAALQFAFGFGAWNLRPWAWLLGVISVGWGVLNAVISMFGGDVFSGIMNLIIPGAILFYLLFDNDVKRAFGRG